MAWCLLPKTKKQKQKTFVSGVYPKASVLGNRAFVSGQRELTRSIPIQSVLADQKKFRTNATPPPHTPTPREVL